MIRGILLLILSCVVLTLQQYPCVTCGSYATENVCDSAAKYYPIDDYGIDFTQPPDNGADLVAKYSKLSSKSLFTDTNTAGFQTIQNEAISTIDKYTQDIAALMAKKDRVLEDINLAGQCIDGDRRNLDNFVSTIYDPLPAVDHCTRALYIHSRREYFDRVIKYLDICITAKVNLKIVWETYNGLIGTCLTLSKKIDTLVKTCGIGLLCSRSNIITTLLVDPLMVILTSGISECGRSISQIQVKLQADLSANPDVFVALTVNDNSRNIIRAEAFANLAYLEHFGIRSFIEIQSSIANVLHNPNHIFWLIEVLLVDFGLAPNRQFVCTGWNDPHSHEVSCTLTSKISVLNAVNLDLTIGAQKLAHICRVVTLALTGCLNVVATPLSIANDGAVVIDIRINADYHNFLQIPYEIPEIVNVCGINSILSGGQINQNLLSILEECEVVESSTLRSRLDDIIRRAIQAPKGGEIIELIHTRQDAETALNADCQNSLQVIRNSVDPTELAQEAFQRCVSSKAEYLEILRTVYSHYETTKSQTAAKVASCQRDILHAKENLLNHPDNEYYSNGYPTYHQALVDSLKTAIGFQVQYNQLCDSLQARIDIEADIFATLSVALETNVNAIINGIVKLISTLRIEIRLKFQLIISYIISVITAFRPTCGIIDINFIDLEDTSSSIITVEINIEDTLLIDELIVDMRSCHRSIIKAALIVCLGFIEVDVVDIVYIGVGQYQYRAIIGRP
jgi:hypothetical protein